MLETQLESGLYLLPFMIAVGALGGFMSSTPLGVINLWIVDETIKHGKPKLGMFIAGIVAADMLYAAIAAWGYAALFYQSPAARWLEIAGGIFVVVLGLSQLLKLESSAQIRRARLEHSFGVQSWKDFTLGAFMCGSNPAFLMFWVFVVQWLEANFNVRPAAYSLGAFVAGIAIGDMLWFRLLMLLVRHGKRAVHHMQPRLLTWLRAALALGFVTAGGAAVTNGLLG